VDGALSLRRTLEIYFSYFAFLTPGARIVWFAFDVVYYALFAMIALPCGTRKAQEILIALGLGRAICLLRLPDGNKALIRRNDRQFLRQVYLSRCYDAPRLEPGDMVLDVGAQIGFFTLRAARRGASLVALEPEPSNHALLRRNVALNGFQKVMLLRKAASSASSLRSLSFSPVNPGIHSLRFQVGLESLTVEAVTLDELAEQLGLREIAVLKIDVEGEELEVLKGAQKLLPRVREIILEVDGGDAEFGAVSEFLSRFGFETRLGRWRIAHATRPGRPLIAGGPSPA
jgi:FkbM family methyltransferase